MENTVSLLLTREQHLLLKQRAIYIESAKTMNLQMRDLIKQDFGTTLVQNCAKDFAGEIIRRFFDTSDYYITVDQLADRLLHFSYENDNLPSIDEQIRKNLYNQSDSPLYNETLKNIEQTAVNSQKKLFTESRKDDILDRKGKIEYRDYMMKQNGELRDELSGYRDRPTTVKINGKDQIKSSLQVDHIQPRNAAQYNSMYMTPKGVEDLKEFYNSKDNFQLIHATANTSKGDLCICSIDGNIQSINARDIPTLQKNGHKVRDITSKVPPEQMADAIIEVWEKDTPSGSKKDSLLKADYLDENGKIKPNVRERLVKEIKTSQNKESLIILKGLDYKQVSCRAAGFARESVNKIIVGQIVYYVLPPLIFETQSILRKTNMTLENFFSELKKAGLRITQYVKKHIKDIIGSTVQNSFSKFIKTFFDIIIDMLKATVKRLIKIIKQVVMSLFQCIRLIFDPNISGAQKGDAIMKTLSVTIGTVIIDIIIEYLQVNFGFNEKLLELIQVIVTILATNIIMLLLEKMDLFNVRYGFLVANIERIFDETYSDFLENSNLILQEGIAEMEELKEKICQDIQTTKDTIQKANLYTTDVTPELDAISKIFKMEIDFSADWNAFITKGGVTV